MANPVASPAVPPAVLAQLGIFCVVWVSLATVGLLTVCASPAPNVFFARDRFQVGGIYAVAHSAKMIYLEPIRNGAYEKFVGEAVGLHLAAVDLELPISIGALCGSPKPTSLSFVDLGPKSIA